jgi:hypothetical protein
MYPASRLVQPDPRPTIVPKLLSPIAAMVLLLSALEIFFALKPGPAHFAERGHRVPSCPIRLGHVQDPIPIWQLCHLVTRDQRIPLRVGIGVGAGILVVALMATATSASRRPPVGA